MLLVHKSETVTVLGEKEDETIFHEINFKTQLLYGPVWGNRIVGDPFSKLGVSCSEYVLKYTTVDHVQVEGVQI